MFLQYDDCSGTYRKQIKEVTYYLNLQAYPHMCAWIMFTRIYSITWCSSHINRLYHTFHLRANWTVENNFDVGEAHTKKSDISQL